MKKRRDEFKQADNKSLLTAVVNVDDFQCLLALQRSDGFVVVFEELGAPELIFDSSDYFVSHIFQILLTQFISFLSLQQHNKILDSTTSNKRNAARARRCFTFRAGPNKSSSTNAFFQAQIFSPSFFTSKDGTEHLGYSNKTNVANAFSHPPRS
jgi:hypothetical protein